MKGTILGRIKGVGSGITVSLGGWVFFPVSVEEGEAEWGDCLTRPMNRPLLSVLNHLVPAQIQYTASNSCYLAESTSKNNKDNRGGPRGAHCGMLWDRGEKCDPLNVLQSSSPKLS